MADKNILMWLLLLAVFLVCVWWHVYENRQLIERWGKEMDSIAAGWLRRFAWSRSFQFLSALAICMLIIVVYDWQLSDTRYALTASEKSKDDALQKLAQAESLAAKAPAAAPAPAPVTTPAPAAAPVIPSPPAQETVDTIYNPEKTTPGAQSAMDDIKKRYEDLLVNYFFLKKCGLVGANDYPIITSALGQEMASVNAPGRMQYDVVTSAQGSYNEVYSKTSCEGNGVTTLAVQYSDYVKTLSARFPTQ